MKDGGQAFPVPAGHIDANGNTFYPEYSMSLRDWFAGQALAGILAEGPHDCGPDGIAHDAYLFADAMLKEREK